MPTPALPQADPALLELIHQALSQSAKPTKAGDIKKAVPKPYKNSCTPALLDEVAASGHIIAYRRGGKSVGYGLRPLVELTREAILSAVGETPQDWAALKKHAAIKAVSGLQSAKDLDAARESLIADESLFEWSNPNPIPKTKAKAKKSVPNYTTRPADVHRVLKDLPAFETARDKFLGELEKLAKGLKRAGVKEAELRRAVAGILFPEVTTSGNAIAPTAAAVPAVDLPYEPRLATVILDRMIDEEPGAANGAPVALRNLRKAMEFQLPGKQAFDDAIRSLVAEGVLALHRHDFPGALTEAERDAMIPDGRGGYYLAVSRRS